MKRLTFEQTVPQENVPTSESEALLYALDKVMTAEEYSMLEHATPYLYELKAGGKELYYFGAYIAKPDQKWILANTAFKVLCNKVFATDALPYSYLAQFTPPLLTKLLWFFRPYFYNGPNGWDNLRPYSTEGLGKDGGKHYLVTAESFARKFATDLWQIANGFWYYLSDSSERPKRRDVLPYLKEIVYLMDRLKLLETFRSGQFVPSPDVFRQMVGIALQMANQGECLDYKGGIRESNAVLEPLAEGGSKLADVLLSARLHVERQNSERQGGFAGVLLREWQLMLLAKPCQVWHGFFFIKLNVLGFTYKVCNNRGDGVFEK